MNATGNAYIADARNGLLLKRLKTKSEHTRSIGRDVFTSRTFFLAQMKNGAGDL